MSAWIAWHRPGADCLEILREDAAGGVEFTMSPWGGSQGLEPLSVRGVIEKRELENGALLESEALLENGGTTRGEHLELICRAQEAIKRGDFVKVVLSRTLECKTGPVDLEHIVQKHAVLHPDSFSWAVRHPAVGTWFGSTPEILLEGEREHYKTVSLAGTRLAHSEDPPWTQKDLLEQQIVTDGLLESLSECRSDVRLVGAAQTVRYGDLEHLSSVLEFDAACGADQLMDALHPTPAVGGHPRAGALAFIRSEEKHNRGYYTGLVGLREAERVSMFVNLRCASWADGVTTAYAGGGITAESDPESEWAETQMKALSVLKAVGPCR